MLQRPTLLIGHGLFGRDVLRRLLEISALRGVLDWDEQFDNPRERGRRTRGVTLLSVQDTTDDSAEEEGRLSMAGGSKFELTRDLYRQIEEVGTDLEDDLIAKAMQARALALIDANRGFTEDDQLPVGLDVIVITSSQSPDTFNRFDRVLRKGMAGLHELVTFKAAARTAPNLNFIKIVDFEQFWRSGWDAENLRFALRESLDEEIRRQAAGEVHFGRVYVSNSDGRGGNRDRARRVDEATLFIEFLLFGGQRSGDLQDLYQPVGPESNNFSPLATFGVSVLQRNLRLQAQLRAADVCRHWLAYLLSRDGDLPSDVAVVKALAPFEGDRLKHIAGQSTLSSLLEEHVEEARAQMLAVDVEHSEWPSQVKSVFEYKFAQWSDLCTRYAEQGVDVASSKALEAFSQELRKAVLEDLTNTYGKSVHIGRLLAYLERARARFSANVASSSATATGETLNAFERELKDVHLRYRATADASVSPAAMRQVLWPFMTLFLAGVAWPLVSQIIAVVPLPASPVWPNIALTWLSNANPLVLLGAMMAVIYPTLRFVVHPRIAKWLVRSQGFFRDEQRGRLGEVIRRALVGDEAVTEAGGGLWRELRARQEQAVEDVQASITHVVLSELVHVEERLAEREREIEWLRKQLKGFLKRYDADELAQDPSVEFFDLTSGVRRELPRVDLPTFEPTPESFESLREDTGANVFEEWHERYCRTFLDPLGFIEQFSARFFRQLEQDQDSRRASEEPHIDRFISARVGLAFHWEQQAGLPTEAIYCVLPAGGHEDVAHVSSLANTPHANVLMGSDKSRTYKLTVLIGIAPECMGGGS